MRIDFHTHTTCSDGQYTPEELVQKAAAAGICALAITDHDAVSGIARGKQAAKAFPQLQIFPGIEISAKENPQLHILGYGIDGENADLQAYITRNRTLHFWRKKVFPLPSKKWLLPTTAAPQADRILQKPCF